MLHAMQIHVIFYSLQNYQFVKSNFTIITFQILILHQEDSLGNSEGRIYLSNN